VSWDGADVSVSKPLVSRHFVAQTGDGAHVCYVPLAGVIDVAMEVAMLL